MSDALDPMGDARAEAAQWVARLNSLPVSTDTLRDFFAWRRLNGHHAAYDDILKVWNAAASIADRPAMQALAEEAYHRGDGLPSPEPARRNRNALATLAASFIVVGTTYALSVRHLGDSYATKVGEQRIVTLEDGSRVTLDTDTRLRVRFTPASRHVELLRGQAYFTVAHNRARPFVVDADDMGVRATGTQFDVRRTGEGPQVTLVEGSVVVTPPHRPTTRLAAGQQLSLYADGPPLVRHVDIASVTAWRQGWIVLDDVRLDDAITEINRYVSNPVRLDAHALAGKRVGGSFATGDIASFVTAVTATLPLRAITDRDGSLHLTSTQADSVSAAFVG